MCCASIFTESDEEDRSRVSTHDSAQNQEDSGDQTFSGDEQSKFTLLCFSTVYMNIYVTETCEMFSQELREILLLEIVL